MQTVLGTGLLLLMATAAVSQAAKGDFERTIPSFLKVCHRSDPDLDDCVKRAVEDLRPYLINGIPELGIPSCEPLLVPEVVINQGAGAVNVRSTYSDIEVYGPSTFELRSIRVDLDNDRVRLKLYLPSLHLSGRYSMEGRILMLPISGNGFSEGNYTDIEATCTILGEKFQKRGHTYFNITKFLVNFDIGHARVMLDDLFDGDKDLGDAMNLFLNDNWRNVAEEIKPVLEETIGELFKRFSNKIYHKFPLDQLLPP